MSWKYFIILRENSKNYKEIFQIIKNGYFEEDKCGFNYPYDSNYFINVYQYLVILLNNNNYYSLLYDFNKNVQIPIKVNAFNEKMNLQDMKKKITIVAMMIQK